MVGFSGRLILDFQLWRVVLGCALAAAAIYVYRRTYPPISRRRRILLAVLRVSAFLMLAFLMLDPVLVSTETESFSPLVVALLDVSKSMSIRDQPGGSRLSEAVGRLQEFEESLIASSEAQMIVLPFSSGPSGAPARLDSAMTADGEGTDIWEAVRSAQMAYRSSNLSAFVLLSDGRITRGMVTSGGAVVAPVYTVGFGDTIESADVSIQEVRYEKTVYSGTVSKIEAILRIEGFRGSDIEVRLSEGGHVLDSMELGVTGGYGEFGAALSYPAPDEGYHRLVVEAVPPPGEERTENNSEVIGVNVRKDRIRLLYLDQFPDWNLTFLRDLFGRSERFEMETVSWTPGEYYIIVPGREKWSFPASAAGFEGYDVIVVSDDSRLLSERPKAEVLADYVMRGGGLLLLADEHSPARYIRSLRLLENILPVRAAGTPGLELAEGFITVARGYEGDPIAAPLEVNGENGHLPPILGRIVGLEVTAGASVPLVVNVAGSSHPFLAVQRYGKGVSAIVLGFPLWRIKLAGETGESAYEAFMGRLLQYIAEGARLPAMVLDANRSVYRAGERIEITAYLDERRPERSAKGEVRRRENGRESLVRTFLFEPDPERSNCLRADLDPLAPGEYGITAAGPHGGVDATAGEVELSVLPLSVELIDTSRDEPFLRRLAQLSGGRRLEPDQLRSLPPEMELGRLDVEKKEIGILRSSPVLFALVVALLAAEWLLRKSWGLV